MNTSRIEELADARRTLVAELLSSAALSDGLAWTQRHTELADDVLRLAVASAVPNEGPEIAVIATGGYGRSELAPFSDVDLTVVPLDEGHPDLDATIRAVFHAIDEAFGRFGLKVGYAYRLIADVPGLDSQTRTALLDARFVAGSHAPYERLLEQFWETFPTGEFLIAKIAERERQFEKCNETPLVVEPHLKEGAGGLRCFQAANWIGSALGERHTRPNDAYRAVLQMRNVLHAVAGRAADHLTRVRQGEIAEALERDMFAMSSVLADHLLVLHGHYRRAQERIHESRFELVPGVQAMRGEARIDPAAPLASAAQGVAIATRLGLSVGESTQPAEPRPSTSEVLSTLAAGEPVLRNLDRSGLLARILPELVVCRTLMPDDSAHTYTVYEHTLRSVRFLDSLRDAPGLLGEIFGGLQDLEPLYLGALLHDVGKHDRSGRHSETGARIAAEVAPRLGMVESVTETVVWLVRNHLEMARMIRMRDVHQPETVREFVDLVRTKERLDLLTLLTWADVNAVGEGAWTPAQDAFLRDLYHQAVAALHADEEIRLDPKVFRQQVLRQLQGEAISQEDLSAFLESLPAHYLLGTAPDLVRLHFQFAQKARQGESTIELFQRDDLQATDVTICTPDAPGLLSRVLGVFYALDLAPLGLRASTTRDESPVALDVFTVTFNGRPLPRATCALVVKALERTLAGEDVAEFMRNHGKDPDRRQVILSHTYRPGKPGILEVRAPLGRGMAYRISRLIAAHGWNIVAARVGQWAGQGAAAFYLLDRNHALLESEEVAAAFD